MIDMFTVTDQVVEIDPEHTAYLLESGLELVDQMPEVAELLRPLGEINPAARDHGVRVGSIVARALDQLEGVHTDGTSAEYSRLRRRFFTAGTLHDIGKQVPIISDLIDRPGRLSPEECVTVSQHTEGGARIVRKFLKDNKGYIDPEMEKNLQITEIVNRCHHDTMAQLALRGRSVRPGIVAVYYVHLADQLDARTDRSRMHYQCGPNKRPNPGVEHGEFSTAVQPAVLMSEIARRYTGLEEVNLASMNDLNVMFRACTGLVCSDRSAAA